MICEKYINLINDLVENELDSQTADEVNLHIFSCPGCEAEFEILNREKKIYTQFLFEIEPPKNLSARFQANLDDEIHAGKASQATNSWLSTLFASISLKPIFAAAVVLLAIGLGYFWLGTPIKEPERTFVLQPQPSNDLPAAEPESRDFEKGNPNRAFPEVIIVKSDPPKRKEGIPATIKKVSYAESNRSKRLVFNEPQAKKTPNPPSEAREEALQIRQIRAFEIETAKQLERVEMLLRSLRNAGYVEGSEDFDIAYEKEQAGRLLARNLELRRRAEAYGSILTNEMLSKVEPYLLEISNLDANPTAEELMEIKQRVRNQNIIASLQSF